MITVIGIGPVANKAIGSIKTSIRKDIIYRAVQQAECDIECRITTIPDVVVYGDIIDGLYWMNDTLVKATRDSNPAIFVLADLSSIRSIHLLKEAENFEFPHTVRSLMVIVTMPNPADYNAYVKRGDLSWDRLKKKLNRIILAPENKLAQCALKHISKL